MRSETLVIASRFCGPPQSGNGGYVCGRLAKLLAGPSIVRLKAPPPLERELRADILDEEVRLFQDSTLIAVAKRAELSLHPPMPPSFAEAEEASKSYVGFVAHVFPRCFVCGPARAPGDGLRIFPGVVNQRPLVAGPWVPDASLADGSGRILPEFIWSALDCTSSFSFLPLPDGGPVLLGELSAHVHGSVTSGEKCVVVGWALGVDGRKHYAGSALFSGGGKVVAVARATWFELPPDRRRGIEGQDG
jgi:hypothetical protein